MAILEHNQQIKLFIGDEYKAKNGQIYHYSHFVNMIYIKFDKEDKDHCKAKLYIISRNGKLIESYIGDNWLEYEGERDIYHLNKEGYTYVGYKFYGKVSIRAKNLMNNEYIEVENTSEEIKEFCGGDNSVAEGLIKIMSKQIKKGMKYVWEIWERINYIYQYCPELKPNKYVNIMNYK